MLQCSKRGSPGYRQSIYEPGENVLSAGSTTGKLFVLKSGTVEVEGWRTARGSRDSRRNFWRAGPFDGPTAYGRRPDDRAVGIPRTRTRNPAEERSHVLALLSRDPRETAGQRQPSANRSEAPASGWRASSSDRCDGR